MRFTLPSSFALSSLFVLAACGGGAASSPTQTAPIAAPVEGAAATPSSSTATSKPAAAIAPASDPHGLAVSAVACWFGGVWGDALGESVDQRRTNDEARCKDVVRNVWGADDKTHYEQLRALESHAVDDVVTKVGTDTAAGRELRLFAGAQKEALDARRAGDKVKRDVMREPDKLTKDEVGAVPALTESKALYALVQIDDGDLTHEGHALGVMTAMERLESSRGLPKHLKVYAMQAPVGALFNLTPPPMPDDATKPLTKGVYLTFATAAAKAAGHPVPDTAKGPREQEPLAWAGVLQGVSDKLKPDLDGISKDTPLAGVVAHVAHRLDAQQPTKATPPVAASPKPSAPTPPAKTPAAPAPKTSAPAATK